MGAGSLSSRSSSEDQVSGRSRMAIDTGSMLGAYCVARGQTVKVVQPDLFAIMHECNTPSRGSAPSYGGQERTRSTLWGIFAFGRPWNEIARAV